MAIIALNPGESFTLTAGSGTGNFLYGTTAGRETVFVVDGVHTLGGDFNAGGDTVRFAGNASHYLVSRSGSSIIFTGPNNTIVTMPAPNPAFAVENLPTIAFADTSFKLASSTIGGFAVTIGGEPITGTPRSFGLVSEPPLVFFDVTVADVHEGQDIVFVITLSRPSPSAYAIEFDRGGGTATPGTDFGRIPFSVDFAFGQTVATLRVPTMFDADFEPTETLTLRAFAPLGFVQASTADLTVAIRNNDPIVNLPGPDIAITPDGGFGLAA